jgi:hypothetical protein
MYCSMFGQSNVRHSSHYIVRRFFVCQTRLSALPEPMIIWWAVLRSIFAVAEDVCQMSHHYDQIFLKINLRVLVVLYEFIIWTLLNSQGLRKYEPSNRANNMSVESSE